MANLFKYHINNKIAEVVKYNTSFFYTKYQFYLFFLQKNDFII